MLTTAEVAELLGGDTTDAWVRERCADGTIPAHKIGRSWRIKREDFDAWLDHQRFTPMPIPTFESASSSGARSKELLVELFKDL